MAWAIVTIYISKCAQMNPQQLPKTSKFYSICKKCDIEKTLGGWYHPLGSPKVKLTTSRLFDLAIWGKWPNLLSHPVIFLLCIIYGQCTRHSYLTSEVTKVATKEIIYNRNDQEFS